MKRILLTLAAISTLSSLSARELMCEQCIEQPDPCSLPHLFVERSQVFVNTTFLYWTADEGVLDYAVKTKGTSTLANTFAIGDYKTADFNWSPGYRIAVTYYKCHKYWEVTGEYTWLYTKGSDHTNAPLNPTRQTLTDPPFQSANSLIDLHYHVGDFFAARVADPNEHLRIRALAGLTTCVIKQGWRIIYSDTQGNFDKVKEKWRYFGGGLRFGATVDWFWGYHFYFTGKSSFATLIGTYKNETIQTNGNNNLLLSHAKYDDHRFSFNVQFMLGPSWQRPYDCWSYEIFAGYEFNLWYNLHERIRSEFSPPDGTKATSFSDALLGLQGLTLRMTIGF